MEKSRNRSSWSEQGGIRAHYRLKAANTKAPINTATDSVMRARNTLAMQSNGRLAVLFRVISVV
jgi:hypothetical protein